MGTVLFRLAYVVREMGVQPLGGWTFDLGGNLGVTVVVRAPTTEERVDPNDSTLCVTTGRAEPRGKVLEVFDQIASETFETTERSTLEYDGPTGKRIRLPALSSMPEPYRDFLRFVSSELHDKARRTISAIRWRAGVMGPHNPISSNGLDWSLDGSFWHPASGITVAQVEMIGITVRMSEQACSEVLAVLTSEGSGPIHHDLFREAWALRGANPRSALVMGMAAAEVGIKDCIARLVPEAQWLAMNVPTPPLIQIITEFFPKLPLRPINGRIALPPKTLLDDLRKGVTLRNELAHKGAAAISWETITSVLAGVRDLLWLTDYYAGAIWALEHLRPSTKAELGV